MKELIGKDNTILIVEDDVSLRNIMVDGLQEYFDKIVVADDGLDALEKLKNVSVSMVVTDYKMPRMNGLQFIEKMKDLYPLIPVLMLTANGTSPEILTVLEKGLFDVIEKPYELEVLLNRIRTSIFLNTLLKIVWDMAKHEIAQPKLEEFMKLPMERQFKIVMAYGSVLRMKASKRAS